MRFSFYFTLSDCAFLSRKSALVILVITFAHAHESSVIVYGILIYVRGLLFHFVVVTCSFVKAKQKRVTEINNNYLLRWRW